MPLYRNKLEKDMLVDAFLIKGLMTRSGLLQHASQGFPEWHAKYPEYEFGVLNQPGTPLKLIITPKRLTNDHETDNYEVFSFDLDYDFWLVKVVKSLRAVPEFLSYTEDEFAARFKPEVDEAPQSHHEVIKLLQEMWLVARERNEHAEKYKLTALSEDLKKLMNNIEKALLKLT